MLALFFEVCPRPGKMDAYLNMAALMKPLLDETGGCLFIDRFKSVERPGWLLSYQIWRDEAAMVRWRTHARHHQAQCAGREEIFADYRLRVAQVVREVTAGKPAWQPARLNTYNDLAAQAPRYIAVAGGAGTDWQTAGEVAHETYESIYRPGQHVRVYATPSLPAALDLTDICRVGGPIEYVRICEIERDYGMFDRGEAPQYYPEIAPADACPIQAGAKASLI